jgi:hypothetical protein
MNPFPYTTIVLGGGVALGLLLASGWALLRRGRDAQPATTGETAGRTVLADRKSVV